MSTTHCPADKREAILNYLHSNVENGSEYYKAKEIGNDIGLSSKEVGSNLQKLAEEDLHQLDIEPWSVTRATTWKVESRQRELQTA